MHDKLCQILSYFRHACTSINTLGHHIHSPYLFEFVRLYAYDYNSYYCFDKIEQVRHKMQKDLREIYVEDFGTGVSESRLVADIAKTSLESKSVAQLLFRLLQYTKANNIIELGTSLGITTAYLAAGNSASRVRTFEGSGEIAAIAQENWKAIGLKNIEVTIGNIDDTLYNIEDIVDFAFIDANHTEEATIRYFDYLAQYKQLKSVFAIDDIHRSREMERAWKHICEREDVSVTMDFYHVGLVFFDPHFMKKKFRLRIG